jgi:hypothetical protein
MLRNKISFSSDDESSDDDILEEKDEDSDANLGPEFEAPPSPTNPLIVELEDGVTRKERRAQVDNSTNNNGIDADNHY